MIDWNGNGKIDPVDIGISISASQDNNRKEYPKKQGGGCLMVISVVAFAVMIKQ